jgi:hypothetical protein
MDQEVDLSRRKFLKFGGLVGLSLGLLGLASLGSTTSMRDAGQQAGQEEWLEAKKKSTKKKTSGKKKSANEGGKTDWQAIA